MRLSRENVKLRVLEMMARNDGEASHVRTTSQKPLGTAWSNKNYHSYGTSSTSSHMMHHLPQLARGHHDYCVSASHESSSSVPESSLFGNELMHHMRRPTADVRRPVMSVESNSLSKSSQTVANRWNTEQASYQRTKNQPIRADRKLKSSKVESNLTQSHQTKEVKATVPQNTSHTSSNISSGTQEAMEDNSTCPGGDHETIIENDVNDKIPELDEFSEIGSDDGSNSLVNSETSERRDRPVSAESKMSDDETNIQRASPVSSVHSQKAEDNNEIDLKNLVNIVGGHTTRQKLIVNLKDLDKKLTTNYSSPSKSDKVT
ncbi:hypothetical protein AB6A40_005144 [Gnathostoma spinigerum]|uniref:Uncharacterized protein n=1 Tax=Gnathostoma spinigerum TaxID=75299 RepID=A0ABD6EQ95_9BILA